MLMLCYIRIALVMKYFNNAPIFNEHYKIVNVQCMCVLPSIHDVTALADKK